MGEAMDILGALLAFCGSLLFFGSGVGMVRLPDFYTRLHAPTKVASLGLILFALAATLRLAGPEHIGVLLRLAILIGLVFVTVPISAQMLMVAAITARVPEHPGTRGRPEIEPLDPEV